MVALRSSEGPGKANDVLDHSSYLTRRTPCGTAEKRGSWWRVDLGKDYLLFLTHYALRHGKNTADSLLCGWELLGSNEGKHWKELHTVKRKKGKNLWSKDRAPYFTGTWAFINKVGAFRYFKIKQVGKNSSNKFGMFLYGIELYGVLFKVESDIQTKANSTI